MMGEDGDQGRSVRSRRDSWSKEDFKGHSDPIRADFHPVGVTKHGSRNGS